MLEKEELLIGFLIGSISILRDMNMQFTEKSRNKLADRIMELLTAYEDSQLEIEELKTTIDLFKNANDNVADITQTIINKNYVSKDKIKAKIEYNKVFNDDIHKYTTLTLEEFLEKE